MTVTSDVDAVSSELLEECPQPVTKILDTLTSELSALREQVDQQSNEIEELRNEKRELEDELGKYQDHIGREFAEVRGRISEVENRVTEGSSGSDTPGVEEGETVLQNSQTPLERVCALPEHIADCELTVNQERARFIARDVQDYAEKAPAGLVINSQTVKKVITASEGKRPHTQTVARVMNFLADLGQEDVELIKRRGKKLIVVDEEMANRLNHNRCDRGTESIPARGVIS